MHSRKNGEVKALALIRVLPEQKRTLLLLGAWGNHYADGECAALALSDEAASRSFDKSHAVVTGLPERPAFSKLAEKGRIRVSHPDASNHGRYFEPHGLNPSPRQTANPISVRQRERKLISIQSQPAKFVRLVGSHGAAEVQSPSQSAYPHSVRLQVTCATRPPTTGARHCLGPWLHEDLAHLVSAFDLSGLPSANAE